MRARRRTDAHHHSTAATVVRWSGRVAFVLAFAVGGGWAVSLIITSLSDGPISPEGASILSTIGGVLAGGIAAYLGNTSQRDPNERTRATDPDHTHAAPDSHNGLSTDAGEAG